MNLTQYLREFSKQNGFLSAFLILRDFVLMLAGLASANALTALVHLRLQSFLIWMLLEIAAYTFYCFSLYIQDYYSSKIIQRMDTAIRRDIAKRISQSNYQDYHARNDAVYTSWMTNDINTINQNGFDNFYDLVDNTANIIFGAAALLFYHYSFIVTVALLSVATLLAPNVFKKRLDHASLEMTQGSEKLTDQITDTLEGFNPLYMMNLTGRIVAKVLTASGHLAEKNNHYAKIYGTMSASVNGISVASQLIIVIQTGILVFLKLIPIGSIVATENFAGSVFSGITGNSQTLIAMKATRPIFDKFAQLPVQHHKSAKPATVLQQSIQLKNVSFAYQGQPILEQTNLVLEKGRKYALVGASGAGKSTLLNLLNTKLTDYQGSLLFDHNNYRDLEAASIREQIYYLDQDPYIFNDSLANNITMDQVVGDDLLKRAIEEAGLEPLIDGLPNGLDTQLSHDGADLSGGQKQRIVLARGRVSGRSIFLVDEGTSALDRESADKIEDSLINNPRITLLMVTHHLRATTAHRLDQIYTLQDHHVCLKAT
ncbi:ATP-binding cassette domain-containing protein [Oenococcus sp.]|uniref:ATP-binding cassette domain-containing protein n=1 Tax=Oenococcus sp. TaxID=1979414 RepID=UPI0039ECD544